MKMPELFDLTGRVAVVIGGNGGIGRGIALGLAEVGAAEQLSTCPRGLRTLLRVRRFASMAVTRSDEVDGS
jgi:NAD(P)-dependent dehydrogenase (short-subunit alcohol dehydrogenase family)